ncbi:ABC transporter permease [Parenemella sanctibonifatiensis]|uniref:ABC transporter permease n=1 Tax=Parenemella sanctibonifatiensis TaxID=2016505 RepID=A0A255EF84_9ACTN|nr:ABC transporter permease [Parenemella sanctibonifatiensis]OYN90207.1 ABC transporter permease [Parenemella sanctibonifatiensis]
MSYAQPSQPWRIVAKREITAQLSDKSFWIGTIITVVLLVGGMALSALFFGDDAKQVGVTDAEGAAIVQIAGEGYEAVELPESDLEAAVDNGDVEAGIRQGDTGWELVVSDLESTDQTLLQSISAYVLQTNASEQGVDLGALNAGTEAQVVLTGEQDSSEVGIATIAGLVFSLLFLMAALTYGMQIAQSVVEEKESRIVEILSAAIPVRQLLIGKVVGNTVMAMFQLILYIAIGAVGVSFTPFSELLPHLLPHIGWFVVFFLFGFASLACLWAAAGAMATRHKDLGNTTTPLTMIIMGVYFAGLFTSGTVNMVLSYVPVVSTVLMPQRLILGEAGVLDAIIALVLTIAFMGVAIWLGNTIYRRGLLQTGGVLKLKDAFAKAD